MARWTPLGSFPTVYYSLSPETATAEAFQAFHKYGFGTDRLAPRVIVAIQAHVERVVALTEPETCAALGLDLAALRADDWVAAQNRGEVSLTQGVASAARAVGCGGLLAPSQVDPAGSNLALFPDRLGVGGSLKIIREHELESITR